MYKAKSPPRTNAPAMQGFTRGALHIETTCLKTIDCSCARFPTGTSGCWSDATPRHIEVAVDSGISHDRDRVLAEVAN